MPVSKQKKKPRDAKSLKEKLDAKAKAQDDKAICNLIQEDLQMGGTARYYTSPDGERTTLNLSSEEEYLVFIIFRGFKVGSSREVYTGNGLGNFVRGESVLTLEVGAVVVIISGY